MDFMNRDARSPQPVASAPSAGVTNGGRRKKRGLGGLNAAFVALLFSGTILVAALVLFLVLGGGPKYESNYVDENKLQAVFLNGGQVYFGRIKDLNKQYVRISDIYYLRVTQQVQPNGEQQQSTPELVKLGCELHGPEDEMLINREQVLFWENLKDDGKVADAVKRYREQYPKGRDCDEQAQDANNNSSSTEETDTESGDDN